jgi:nucleotide-binding universal stress UspA family protein
LEFAVKIAQKESAKVFVFHMLIPSPYTETQQVVSTRRRELEESYGPVLASEEHEYSVCVGASPHLEILQYARDNDVDLIAMGSHTKDKADRWYVGSAVEHVSARSICPVVVVTKPSALSKVEG